MSTTQNFTPRNFDASQVLQSVVDCIKTLDQIDLALDAIYIAESSLTPLVEHDDYFEIDYPAQLSQVRTQAGACLARAASEAHIPDIRHWSDDQPQSLSEHFHEFQKIYLDFLENIQQAAQEIESQNADQLTDADTQLLFNLYYPLSTPILFARIQVTGKNPFAKPDQPVIA